MKKEKSDIPDWIVWGITSAILLISLGVFIVGKFHNQFGVIFLVVGGLLLYISVISLVFKL